MQIHLEVVLEITGEDTKRFHARGQALPGQPRPRLRRDRKLRQAGFSRSLI
jgi:hypothetical protein